MTESSTSEPIKNLLDHALKYNNYSGYLGYIVELIFFKYYLKKFPESIVENGQTICLKNTGKSSDIDIFIKNDSSKKVVEVKPIGFNKKEWLKQFKVQTCFCKESLPQLKEYELLLYTFCKNDFKNLKKNSILASSNFNEAIKLANEMGFVFSVKKILLPIKGDLGSTINAIKDTNITDVDFIKVY